MDNSRFTPRAATGAGDVTTFYSYESGPARSQVLASMALQLTAHASGRAPVPTLMIDWDLESPGLHCLFDADANRPGLLELVTAWGTRHAALVQAGGATLADDELARRTLADVDWHAYIEQVDASGPLYLLRAGCFDDSYGERAAALDWHGIHRACPGLLQQFRIQLAETFRHVFIDARCGRSAAASVCTSLMPDKIIGLFTPYPASLPGLCGVVERAIDYRCSHEEEQRPLLLYPLPCMPGGFSHARREEWRHGAPSHSGGYQDQLEALMRRSYGRTHLSLAAYCDDILLAADTLFNDASVLPRDGDGHVAPAPALQRLLDWFVASRLPWESRAGTGADMRLPARSGERLPSAGDAADTAAAAVDAVAAGTHTIPPVSAGRPYHFHRTVAGHAQFPALRYQGASLRGAGSSGRMGVAGGGRAATARHGTGAWREGLDAESGHRGLLLSGLEPYREPAAEVVRVNELADAVEAQLDQLQKLVDAQALREARSLADTLRHLVLRPAVAFALRRRGAALIKLVYRHDNDTDALLAFTQDELTVVERVLTDAVAGRPLAFS